MKGLTRILNIGENNAYLKIYDKKGSDLSCLSWTNVDTTSKHTNALTNSCDTKFVLSPLVAFANPTEESVLSSYWNVQKN